MLMGPYPDFLETVENGIGGKYSIEYTPSSAYENTRLPFVVHTVSAIRVEDGTTNAQDVPFVAPTDFDYSKGYYDAETRELRGFGQVIRTTEEFTEETLFYQGVGSTEDPEGFQGQVRKITTSDASGVKLKQVESTYELAHPYLETKFPRLLRIEEKLFGSGTNERTLVTTIISTGIRQCDPQKLPGRHGR